MQPPKLKFYTPEQYILKSLDLYPTLYSHSTYDEVKFHVLDHVLNVIGNGITKLSDFKYHDYDFDRARQFITNETIYTGYLKEDCDIKQSGKYEWIMPKFRSLQNIHYHAKASDRSKYPDVFYWLESTRIPRVPYPNFEYEFSLVWSKKKFNFFKLGQEWVDAAIWYYQKCFEFFESDQSCEYSLAFPQADEKSTDRYLKDFQRMIKTYPDYESISEAYELIYLGDDYEFLCRRWIQESTRIKSFIIDTINHLQTYQLK